MSDVNEPNTDADFVIEHYRRYKSSKGADGHLWDSTGLGDHGLIPTLLLTTKGRKSGKLIEVPLIYAEVAGDYVVIGSRGGSPTHPGWYLNLSADPNVEIQVVSDRFTATARTAEGEERENLWPLVVSIYPTYEELQDKTTRQIPLVVLTPQTEIFD